MLPLVFTGDNEERILLSFRSVSIDIFRSEDSSETRINELTLISKNPSHARIKSATGVFAALSESR